MKFIILIILSPCFFLNMDKGEEESEINKQLTDH